MLEGVLLRRPDTATRTARHSRPSACRRRRCACATNSFRSARRGSAPCRRGRVARRSRHGHAPLRACVTSQDDSGPIRPGHPRTASVPEPLLKFAQLLDRQPRPRTKSSTTRSASRTRSACAGDAIGDGAGDHEHAVHVTVQQIARCTARPSSVTGDVDVADRPGCRATRRSQGRSTGSRRAPHLDDVTQPAVRDAPHRPERLRRRRHDLAHVARPVRSGPMSLITSTAGLGAASRASQSRSSPRSSARGLRSCCPPCR